MVIVSALDLHPAARELLESFADLVGPADLQAHLAEAEALLTPLTFTAAEP